MMRTLSLQAKLLMAFLSVGIIPFAVMAITSLYKAEVALHEQAFAQMESMRDVKKGQVLHYLQSIKDQAITFSESKTIIEAMEEFSSSFKVFTSENSITSSDIGNFRSKLSEYYNIDFSPVYKEQNGGKDPGVNSILAQLDDVAIALQYNYIKANEHPLGSKHKLDKANDLSRYSEVHEKFHPIIRNYLEKFGYYDIFLVDPETGKIVYSVFKELDYATSLIN